MQINNPTNSPTFGMNLKMKGNLKEILKMGNMKDLELETLAQVGRNIRHIGADESVMTVDNTSTVGRYSLKFKPEARSEADFFEKIIQKEKFISSAESIAQEMVKNYNKLQEQLNKAKDLL